MNERLRLAFDREPVPRDLEARVRARLDAPAANGWARLLPSLALMAGLVAVMSYNGVTETRRLLRVGIVDHVHCAIGGAYPRQDDRAEMVKAMGPYSVMLKPILDQLRGDEVVSAHRCTQLGRLYMHVIVRREGQLLSVMLTKQEKGDAFPRVFSAGFYAGAGAIRDEQLDGYTVAGFTAGGYLGYVVSSLPEAQSRELAGRLAPVVRRYTGV